MSTDQAEFVERLEELTDSTPADPDCSEAYREGYQTLGRQILLELRAFKRGEMTFADLLEQMGRLHTRTVGLDNLPGHRERGYASHGRWLDNAIIVYRQRLERAA